MQASFQANRHLRLTKYAFVKTAPALSENALQILFTATARTTSRSSCLAVQKRWLIKPLRQADHTRTVIPMQEIVQQHSNTDDQLLTNSKKFDNLFGDHKLSYGQKTTWELTRALTFFFFCKFPRFVENSLQMMELAHKVLGERLAHRLIRATVYDQFVAGESIEEMSQTIAKLRQAGVGPILANPMECFDKDSGLTQDEFFEANTREILDCIGKALALGDRYPMIQLRYTAFLSGDLLSAINPLCKQTMHDLDVWKGLIDAMHGQKVDFAQLPGWEAFPKDRADEFCRGLRRIGRVNEELGRHEMIALVDAEYTWINSALRQLALCSMVLCNTGRSPRLFSTYQAYLKSTVTSLGEDLQVAKACNFSFGLKLVRGAYMVPERQRAKAQGYPDPVNENFEATSRSYFTCLEMLLKDVSEAGQVPPTFRPRPETVLASGEGKNTPGSPQSNAPGTRFMVASHNEDTVLYAMKRMEELGLSKDGGKVFFGQIYGMADHISLVLGKEGYPIYKSIPYGSIRDTLPYLSRRAQENKAILENVRRERTLIWSALKDKLLVRG